MRKINILKVALCTVMFTLMLGTTVFAGTISNFGYKRGVSGYTYSYIGTHGSYLATGDEDYARTSVTNKSSSTRFFYCNACRFNWNYEEYDYVSQYADNLGSGLNVTEKILRDKDNVAYDYFHNSQAFAGTTSSTVKIDDFNYTAKQHY